MERDGKEVCCAECGRLERMDRFANHLCIIRGAVDPKNKVNGCQFFSDKLPSGLPIRSIPITPFHWQIEAFEKAKEKETEVINGKNNE